MTGNIKTMLFDLDGTIIDTNELIIRSFIDSLQGVTPVGFGREHIIPSMGQPLTDQMRLFSGLQDVTHLVAAYREINLRLHDEYVKAFDYVIDVIARLHGEGIQIGVVTTKMRLTTERGLKYVGLSDYIDAIVTIDDVVNPKPHAEPVSRAIELLGAEPASTMMVGDSTVDIESAIAAGAIAVGVAWSLKGEQKLKEAGAHHIIHDMRDLYSFVGLERETLA
ncbi:pyrophosphatase PpaX [Paenibacillus sp. FSL H8-0548]|uniref:pyrophosphatase PpaX n=1 Tax=Paenibacillus sp. FSL H8-0548 TaxID=1920422 RepID=UPI00096CE472|nr:pyrophosphatase PpaX [Paenibacillus sp. FSL H8-0548]OMF25665.1 pyrophosphatase PpaX [Paenibacillus sp. FSL H8-0548]